ncbi:MAG: site-specific integrase, partial [Chloroflexi bacterium]|nr:site-specific integrase [Chloroflexota bacterium]
RRRILRQELRPAARAAGLADSLRTHDLRHTAISLLLNQGLPIPMVSSYVGHADPSVTLRVYAHAIPSTQHEVADAAQSLFGA